MKKLFLSLLAILFTFSARAELQSPNSFSATPYVGVGYTFVSNTNYTGCFSWQIGLDFKYKFGSCFGVGVGVNYINSMGLGAEDLSKVIESESESTAGLDSEKNGERYFNFSFVEIPILLHFDITKHFGLYTGCNLSFNTSTTYHAPELDEKWKLTEVDKFSCSIPIGLRFSFKTSWAISLQYNFPIMSRKGYLDVATDTYTNIKMSPLLLTIGYCIDFKKAFK